MNVLVIRFSSLGDVIIATAVLEALKGRYPDSTITFLTKSIFEQVFSADDRVDRLVGIDGHESPRNIIDRLGSTEYDAVIDLHRSIRSIGITALLKSPLKLHVRQHALGRRFMMLSRNRFRRRFDALGSYLETISPLGIDGRVLPRIMQDTSAADEGERILSSYRQNGGGRYIGIAPGARHATKRWNEQSFAALADELLVRGEVPVFLGDTDDRDMIERIDNLMTGKAWSLSGELSLAGTIGLVSRLDAVVSNDSGPMHLAGALGIPFVAIFGPTHPDLGFSPGYPRGVVMTTGEPCSPCSLHGAAPCRMSARRCMDGITPHMVRDALDEILK